MPSDVTFDAYPLPLDDDSIPILVYRYDPSRDEGDRYTLLPNVYCRRVSFKEGAIPPSAQFEYVFDDSDLESPYPYQFEEVWPLTAQGPWVVENDDRLVVIGVTHDDVNRLIFDGFAQIPQVDVSPTSQSVTFTAIGTPVRCWDEPIGGAWYRNADDPERSDEGNTVRTELPTRFNPNRKPNCTPEGKDSGEILSEYPQFLDCLIVRDPDPRTPWTLGKAVRYLLTYHNDQTADPLFVENPWFSSLDFNLQSRKPKDNKEFYDPRDPATYDSKDIEIRDYDATGKCWPDVVAELCSFAGAQIRFELGQDEQDEPKWSVIIYRKDASTPVEPLDVYFQKVGEDLDTGRSNVSDLHISRDSATLVNSFQIVTNPIQVEASIVLAMGFTPVAGDESETNRKKYLLSALAGATSEDKAKYRLYVADEAGDGHYDVASGTFVKGIGNALDLSAIFGEDDPDTGPQYVKRLRPADGLTLVTKDLAKKARRAVLCFSRDYAGPSPAVWDGTGHWQPIPGGWEILKDRFGIYVSIDDPEMWGIGKYTGANAQNSGTSLRGIKSQANPDSPPTDSNLNTQRFFLMLTAVIDSDLMVAARALPREASPSRFVRTRRIDCKDHFKQQVIAANSWYNRTTKPINAKDDTDKAIAHAEAERTAQEFPPLVGSVTIPWLSNAYKVGNRIRSIQGRDVTLQTNAGTNAGEAKQYPFISGVDYDFSGDRQSTVLHYSDRMTGPQDA